MPNECLSEAGEEEGFESFLLPFDITCGPSAQRQGLPAEDPENHQLSKALFRDVLREVSMATEGGSGI